MNHPAVESKRPTNRRTATTVDHLKEDPPIGRQLYTLVSFVSPALDLQEERAIFMTGSFLNNLVKGELNAIAKHQSTYLSTTVSKRFDQEIARLRESKDEKNRYLSTLLSNIRDDIVLDEADVLEKCQRDYGFDHDALIDKFKIFHANNYEKLEGEFNDMKKGIPTITGFKVRGTFAKYEDANERAVFLRDEVESAINVGIVPVGSWVPYNPNPDAVGDVIYDNAQLNTLMGKYNDAVNAKNQFQRERIAMAKRTDGMTQREIAKQRRISKLQDKQRVKRQEQINEYIESRRDAGAGESSGAKKETSSEIAHKRKTHKTHKKSKKANKR